MNLDNLSLIYRKALDILFLKHPTRTSLGVIFGFFLDFALHLFSPIFNNIESIDISEVKLWHLIATGLLFSHSPTFISFIYTKPKGTETIDDIIKLIESGNFSESEKRAKYRTLIDKVLNKALEDNQFNQQMQKQATQLNEEIPPSAS